MLGLNRRVVYGAQDVYLTDDFSMGGYNTIRSGGGQFYYVFNGAQDVYLISEHELLAKNTFVEISRLLRGVLKRVIKHATLGHNTEIDTASRVTSFLNAEKYGLKQ